MRRRGVLASLAIRRAVAPREEEAMLRATVRGHRATGCHIRCVAAQRRGVVTCLSRGTGVQAAAIFDVRALLTPPLAAERMIRLSSKGFSCRNAWLNENSPS